MDLRAQLEVACGGPDAMLNSMDVFEYERAQAPPLIAAPRILGMEDRSARSWHTVSLLPDAPQPDVLAAWLCEAVPGLGADDIDAAEGGDEMHPELAALGALLQEFGSVDGARDKLGQMQRELRQAQLRESRFERDALLASYDLDELSGDQIKVLVLALQNELKACYSYRRNCNLIEHPLVQQVLAQEGRDGDDQHQKIFAAAPLKSHLVDLVRLGILPESPTPTPAEEARAASRSDLRRQGPIMTELQGTVRASLATIEARLQECERKVHSVKPKGDPNASHPGSWENTRPLLEAQTEAIAAASEAVLELRDGLLTRLRKLEAELMHRDEVIELQQDIELKLVESKRDVAAANVQLASLFMRMLFYVYPNLWKKLGAMETNSRLSVEDALAWEAQNDRWLKTWIATIHGKVPPGMVPASTRQKQHPACASDSGTRGGRRERQPRRAERGTAKSETHIATEEGGERARLSAEEVEETRYRLEQRQLREQLQDLSGQRKQLKDILGARAKPEVLQPVRNAVRERFAGSLSASQGLEAALELAFETNIAPNLLSQQQIGQCFGLAQMKAALLPVIAQSDGDASMGAPSTNEKKRAHAMERVAELWLEECAALAFPADLERSKALSMLVKHIHPRLVKTRSRSTAVVRSTIAHSPTRPRGEPRRGSVSAVRVRSVEPQAGRRRSTIVPSGPREPEAQAFHVKHEEALLYGLFELYKSGPEEIAQHEVLALANKMLIVPDLVSRQALLEQLRTFPGALSFEQLVEVLRKLAAGPAKMALLGPAYAALGETPWSRLVGAVRLMTERRHGTGVERNGRQRRAMQRRMDHLTEVRTPKSPEACDSGDATHQAPERTSPRRSTGPAGSELANAAAAAAAARRGSQAAHRRVSRIGLEELVQGVVGCPNSGGGSSGGG